MSKETKYLSYTIECPKILKSSIGAYLGEEARPYFKVHKGGHEMALWHDVLEISFWPWYLVSSIRRHCKFIFFANSLFKIVNIPSADNTLLQPSKVVALNRSQRISGVSIHRTTALRYLSLIRKVLMFTYPKGIPEPRSTYMHRFVCLSVSLSSAPPWGEHSSLRGVGGGGNSLPRSHRTAFLFFRAVRETRPATDEKR